MASAAIDYAADLKVQLEEAHRRIRELEDENADLKGELHRITDGAFVLARRAGLPNDNNRQI